MTFGYFKVLNLKDIDLHLVGFQN